jgi:hypothetical protein
VCAELRRPQLAPVTCCIDVHGTAELPRSTSSTSPVCANGHLDSSAWLQLASPPTTSTIFHFDKAKCYFQFNFFHDFRIVSSTVSDSLCFCEFCRSALHVFVCSSGPPLDTLRGLVLPTRRSPELRVQIFCLVLCSPPPRHARGAWPCQSKGHQTCGVLLLLCVFFL